MRIAPIKSNLSLSVLILWLLPLSAFAQNGGIFTLTAKQLNDGHSANLSKVAWEFHAGDDAAWAAEDFDDRDWKTLTNDEINDDPVKALGGWGGRGWFRLRFAVDESVVARPLAWRVWQWGASEIFIDGKRVKSYGTITPQDDIEYNPRGTFFPVAFDRSGMHTVAIRYSFKIGSDLTQGWGAWLRRGYRLPGFRLLVETPESAAANLDDDVREVRVYFVFVGLFLALALVHFLLFVFYRRVPSNLFYSFFVLGLATSFWLQSIIGSAHFSAAVAQVTDIARLSAQSVAVIALLAFLYVEFVGRPGHIFKFLLAIWIISILLNIFQVGRDFQHVLLMLLLTLADCLRIMMRALRERRDGAWIIAIGVILFVLGVVNNISVEQQFIHIPEWIYQLNLYLTVLSVPLMVSVYLARNSARTNRNLEAQVAQIQTLSARQLEQERAATELRLAHERTQAENERRAKELEEARQLQLSMLPQKLPQIPHLEIAAYMKPASEVGGDYYDFHVDADGTLTVAVGDATGHGLKAGTMVTATKSLFNNLAHEADIGQIFKRSSAALKKMNLRGLFMALTLAKITDRRLTFSCAGMPPVLIYRSELQRVEEISIKAMPLGSPLAAPFEQRELTLAVGDTVLLMSDGFPERFNEQGEMLDFNKAKRLLAVIATEPAQEIINRFVEVGETWAGARAQDDDVTFVVLKVVR